jgi:hypothetical protein
MLAFAAGDYAECIDQNSQCQTDCCIQNGGHFDPDNEIDCIGVDDYMAVCGQPCQGEYDQCMGYGGESNGGTGSYDPGYAPTGSPDSSGSCCCAGAMILAAGLLVVFSARKGQA